MYTSSIDIYINSNQNDCFCLCFKTLYLFLLSSSCRPTQTLGKLRSCWTGGKDTIKQWLISTMKYCLCEISMYRSVSPYRILSLWSRWWCQQANLFLDALKVQQWSLEEELKMLLPLLLSSSHRCPPTPGRVENFSKIWFECNQICNFSCFIFRPNEIWVRCHLCHDHNPDIVRVRFWVVCGQRVRVEDNSSLGKMEQGLNAKILDHPSNWFLQLLLVGLLHCVGQSSAGQLPQMCQT